MRKPCLVCGAVSEGSRCPTHALRDTRKREGYGYAWAVRSKEFRKLYPFCAICNRGGNGIELHVDHIVPRSLGGSDDYSNLRTLCGECHRRYGKTRRSKG